MLLLFLKCVSLNVNCCRATGFTTRSDIGPARDADDIPYVCSSYVCLFFLHYIPALLLLLLETNMIMVA